MKSFLLVNCLVAYILSNAQMPVNIYAWSQVFKPGIIVQRDLPSENGNPPVKKPAAVTQYIIYVAHSYKEPLQLKKIWIKGTWYRVQKATVVTTPVVTEQPESITLIPATSRKVIRAEPGDSLAAQQKTFPALSSMMKGAELIAAYTLKGKTYYLPLKKIKELDPVHAQ